MAESPSRRPLLGGPDDAASEPGRALELEPSAAHEALFNGAFNSGRGVEPMIFLLPLAGIVAAAAVTWFVRRRLDPDSSERPHLIFARLAGRLSLDAAERRLLRRMSEALELPAPTALVISPAVFRRSAAAYLNELPAHERAELEPRLERIGHRLFTASEPRTETETDSPSPAAGAAQAG